MNGNGQWLTPGSLRGGYFKIGLLNGSTFEGPVRLEAGPDSNQIHIGSYGPTELLDAVDISGFESGDLVFSHSRFHDTWPSRTLVSAHPGCGYF
ncbi:hypothetical protein [Salmonirosea aquatica]|uniref:Uncharacterized protein n=1 Tax=Salmonirosea aquatica TaxID=2654236 RepID=A0A7C9B938_9BACT|nr:hypothetical protein [Cytophagaceae bacterium SJW1-29]